MDFGEGSHENQLVTLITIVYMKLQAVVGQKGTIFTPLNCPKKTLSPLYHEVFRL